MEHSTSAWVRALEQNREGGAGEQAGEQRAGTGVRGADSGAGGRGDIGSGGGVSVEGKEPEGKGQPVGGNRNLPSRGQSETVPETVKGEQLPSRGQKRTNRLKSNSRNLLAFPALTGAKSEGKRNLPSRGQAGDHLKEWLPAFKKGAGWWEIPADGSGYRIKLRWRSEGKKPVYVFRRLGKHELERLEGKSNEQKRATLHRRIFTELFRQRRGDLAGRLVAVSGSDQGSVTEVAAQGA